MAKTRSGGGGRAGLAGLRPRALPALGAAAPAAFAVGIAGCGEFQVTPAPAGEQKQIRSGERVGAATRAHPGRVASAAARAALSPSRPIRGADVTAIGDSVMSGSAPALAGIMPGIYIDAKPDRQMPAALAIVRRLARRGELRPVVVMGLGTNYIVTAAQLADLVRIIGPHRKLVLVNTYVPDGWSKQVNATDAAFVRAHPDVVLADWYDTIKGRLNLLWPDQVHPMVPGTLVYARLVYEAVQATRDVTGAAPGVQPVVEHGGG